MENRKVPKAPVPPKHPKHRKPGDFEPPLSTVVPPIIDDPPKSFTPLEGGHDKGKGRR